MMGGWRWGRWFWGRGGWDADETDYANFGLFGVGVEFLTQRREGAKGRKGFFASG